MASNRGAGGSLYGGADPYRSRYISNIISFSFSEIDSG